MKSKKSKAPPQRRDQVLNLLDKYRGELSKLNITSLKLFGSFARDEAKKSSDIDLLIKFDRPVGFFHMFKVKAWLGKKLGRKVDLVMVDALLPEFRQQVESEMIDVFQEA
jgi:uncharacterized protein